MIALLLGAALASDPAALRQLGEDAAGVDVGTEGLGVAVDLGPRLGVQLAPGSAVFGHIGWAAPLVGEDRPWGLDGGVGVGAGALLATPGAALLAFGELRGGLRGERGLATLGLISPLALRLDVPPQLAIPMVLELRLALSLKQVWLGVRGQAGAALVPGAPPAGRASLSGFVALPLP